MLPNLHETEQKIGRATGVDVSVYASQLCLNEPSMSDFNINNEAFTPCQDLSIIMGWMSHTDQLIDIAENDSDLRQNTFDISLLHLRRASLFCSVSDFKAAKACAERALSLYETVLGHFRLGCIQYCLHDYTSAMESLLIAERLEPSNQHVLRALLVCFARVRSLKDRLDVVSSMN